MKTLKGYFHKAVELDSDCYVADFTEYTKESQEKRGVEISCVPFDSNPKLLPKDLPEDFNWFHLKRQWPSGDIRYLAINFEEYPHFTIGIHNCECLFASLAECNKPWVMFLEMKYCEGKNTDRWINKACNQMKETYEKLEEETLLKPENHNVYFTYSVPRNPIEPFGSFETTQSEILEFMEKGHIHFLGYNTLLIATGSRIFPPKKRI